MFVLIVVSLFSPTRDCSYTDATVSYPRISGSAALRCSGFTRAHSVMGEGRQRGAQPPWQIHRLTVRRADHREG